MTNKTITLSREVGEMILRNKDRLGLGIIEPIRAALAEQSDYLESCEAAHNALADPVPPAGGPLQCWNCKADFTLADRANCDGCCWKCGNEIDLDDYVTWLQAEVERLSTGLDYWRGKAIAVANTIAVASQSAPADKGQGETVPKFKFDTLVEHCKRLERDVYELRAEVNDAWLYKENAVWFWQHDGEDYLKSLSCPVVIPAGQLRELLDGKAQHDPMAEQPALVAVVMPSRETLRDRIAQAIGGDTYDCTRVWSAWGVGTMSDDDFVPVVDQESRLYEIADACLNEVARLNGVQP
nr:hypothetical protein [uncultured Pseudomonas sp.]